MEWYPHDKEELDSLLDRFLAGKARKKVNGIVVPHAGYTFSGEIAGKAFSLLKEKETDKAVLLGPSHYAYISGILASYKKEWETPLGKIKLFNTDFKEGDVRNEHSIDNQIPFLQKINPKIEIMPLVVGEIYNEYAEEVAKKLAEIPALYVFSSDLSHFLGYEKASEIDKRTIEIIEKLDFERFNEIDACGKNGLLVLFHLCKLKGWKPKLIEYKNSGNITGDKSGVVGYASFWF